jgi:hypothetical protein
MEMSGLVEEMLRGWLAVEMQAIGFAGPEDRIGSAMEGEGTKS